ncbi:hypothetical protein QFZ49_004964 [Streptomyces turgidiscabies]|uniref:Transposase n=1 Tax=Streptomyces turgidiscabies TaxID=85558 RepID=A0ABU0RST3_9ACTN|nr:hypothetical protein [Streptomyces turgidiscabies]
MEVQSNDVHRKPVKLYPVLDAATSSLTTDPTPASLRGLCALVRGVRDLRVDRVRFLTVPCEAYAYDANRDQLVEPDAGRLFERLRTDSPVAVKGERPVRDDSGGPAPYPLFAGTRPSGAPAGKALAKSPNLSSRNWVDCPV